MAIVRAGKKSVLMVVDMQVAVGLGGHVNKRMARQLIQHMVEKADTGGNGRSARPVEIDSHLDGRLVGLAGNGRAAGDALVCHRGSMLRWVGRAETHVPFIFGSH